MKYLAFDIEIAKGIPEEETDWLLYRPLGVTCAAAASSDGGLWNWYAHDSGRFTDKMATQHMQDIVIQLMELSREYTIVTWNGLGFDFDVLAEESGLKEYCRDLALNHIDMMFHFFCSRGFPLGLDAAAKGMGLPGKPEGMTGAKAPELWTNGEYHRVLDYVSWDVKNTLALAETFDKSAFLSWTSRAGRENHWYSEKWLMVKEALKLPEPDTSWMSEPWQRSKFYEWTNLSAPK